MLRSTDVLIRDFMRGPSVKGTLKQIKRGTIYVDAAELSTKIDGEVVGSIFWDEGQKESLFGRWTD